MNPEKITCSYCDTVNPAAEARCAACGAPLEREPLRDLTPRVTIVDAPPAKTPAPVPKPVKPAAPAAQPLPKQVHQAAKSADDLYNMAWRGYALVWRTAAEVVAIAVCALTLGILDGIFEQGFVGVLGGLLVGVAVGSVRKNWVWSLVSAPLGLLAGILLWLPAWALGAGARGITFSAFAFAIVGALLGGYRDRWRTRGAWEKARPFLGAAGGVALAGIGLLLGLALRAIWQQFVSP
ncbi:MAG: hypothetical protein OHK0052_27290 [Anaerolineales bacterium]